MPERVSLARLFVGDAPADDSTIAVAATGAVSRAQFLRRLSAWQRAFATQAGSRFALHLEDSIEFAAALLGAWQAGKIIYLPADTLPATTRGLTAKVDGFAGSFEGALQAAEADDATMPCRGLSNEDVRLVLYTSGSTGDPLPVGKTLRQLDAEVAALESRFGARLGDALVHGTVSHQHIYGLLFRVLWPLSAGRPFHATRLGYPEQIAAAFTAGPAVLVSSPALLRRLPEALDWSALRGGLRAAFSSGGPLPAPAAASVRELWGQPAIEVFGSTETGGIASREGTPTWTPLPGVQVRIEDGLLQVQSAHLEQSGWWQTQDRALRIGEGFELHGRADRLVKLEERRISLDAIERSLLADRCVESARVLMQSASRARIAAVVVPNAEGKELLARAGRKGFVAHLREALRESVDAIAIPKQWRFLDALPVDSQGKTPAHLLTALFQPARPAPRWLSREAMAANLAVTADAELVVFDGHFRDAPIVPGVALVDWAIGWGREAFGIAPGFARMEAMKFQRVVTPGTELDLSLGWQADKRVLDFRYVSAGGAHASGRIVFAQEVAP
jgi:acyl-coenzyme A synthetase/AMP-(fatty) acid ligase/3-hydroxymyristoyl/3-hydroxydecanoyl-(acyl carrier protein) dehydratase